MYVVKGESTIYGTDPELTIAGCCSDSEPVEVTAGVLSVSTPLDQAQVRQDPAFKCCP